MEFASQVASGARRARCCRLAATGGGIGGQAAASVTSSPAAPARRRRRADGGDAVRLAAGVHRPAALAKSRSTSRSCSSVSSIEAPQRQQSAIISQMRTDIGARQSGQAQKIALPSSQNSRRRLDRSSRGCLAGELASAGSGAVDSRLQRRQLASRIDGTIGDTARRLLDRQQIAAGGLSAQIGAELTV